MSKVINLNKVRKAKSRQAKRDKGAANAALHGLTKPQKDLARAGVKKADADHDGHRKE